MYKVTAYKEGEPVYSEVYGDSVKSEEEARVCLINSMYWNYCTCTEVSYNGWWKEYEYRVEVV